MTHRPAPDDTAAGALVQPSPARLLLVASLGALLAPLNSTMLAVALPTIRDDFGVGHAEVGWLISSYLIAMAVVQPIGGRLGDDLGRSRVLIGGLVAFLVTSIAAAVAPTFWTLVLFRTLQAVSGAILIPNGMGMLRAGVPESRFGTYSGLNSAVIGSTAALGPVVGGALLYFGPWRLLFLLNIPIVIAALALAWLLPRGARAARSAATAIDWAGLTLFVALLLLVTLLLSSVRQTEIVLVLMLAAALPPLTLLFVLHQRQTSAPTASWGLLRKPAFAGASLHILLMNLAMYTTLLAIPFFLVEVQGRSETVAGLLLGCMAALQAVAGPVSGRVSDDVGRRIPTVASSVVALAAALMLALGVSPDVPLAYLAVAVTVLGLGVGIGFVTATVAAIEAAPKALAGSAAGTQSMMRYFGSIVGAGLLAGLLDADDVTGIGTFQLLFSLVAGIAALSVVAAWSLPARKRP